MRLNRKGAPGRNILDVEHVGFDSPIPFRIGPKIHAELTLVREIFNRDRRIGVLRQINQTAVGAKINRIFKCRIKDVMVGTEKTAARSTTSSMI